MMTTLQYHVRISAEGVITLPNWTGGEAEAVVAVPQTTVAEHPLWDTWDDAHVDNSPAPTDEPLQKMHRGCLESDEHDAIHKADDNRAPEKSLLDVICGGWADDERSTEEIIRDIYESRTFGRERELL